MGIKQNYNKKNDEKIILYSKESPAIILGNIQTNSKKYKFGNFIQNDFLCKIKNNRIYIYVPWSIEKREFKGIVKESESGSTLQGRFLIPIRTCCFHVSFWIGVWALLIFLLGNVPDLIKDNYFLILFIATILLFTFDLWYLLIFRSKKYESKIIGFLNNCLNRN